MSYKTSNGKENNWIVFTILLGVFLLLVTPIYILIFLAGLAAFIFCLLIAITCRNDDWRISIIASAVAFIILIYVL